MMGWAILLSMIGVALVLLRVLGVTGAMLRLAGAALLIAACGYSLQGRSGLAGAPRQAAVAADQGVQLSEARHIFFGEFSGNEHWMRMSEAVARSGNTADVAGLLRSAIRQHPNDPMLWIGLGNALVDHGRVMTPPAELAFARAAQLAPGHPAPPFFRGFALARSGDPAAAIVIWRRILATAPADASWRPLVEDGVATLTPAAKRQRRTR